LRNKACKYLFIKKCLTVCIISGFSLLTFSSFNSPSYAQTIYKLKLKNGKTIKTPAYKYAGGMIQYEMYGAFISIKQSSVISVEKETADPVSSKNHAETRTSVYLKIPVYYEVKGAPSRDNLNGIYESQTNDDYEGLPLYRKISGSPYMGIFYQCDKRGKKTCGWVLGIYSRDRGLYINDKASKEPEPVFYSLWKERYGNRNYPDISVRKISPPATVYLGRVSYTSVNFPNNDCNGTFSPISIMDGWVKYKMINNNSELEYSCTSKGWRIRYRGDVAYKAKIYAPGALPEAVQSWEDINQRPINGKIELLKYQ